MKTYIINSEHIVYVDIYENGEKEQVNSYNIKDRIKANNPREAIKLHFEKTLYYSFNFENACIDHEEINTDNINTLHYSVLVDAENSEASESEINEWKQGKKLLYCNNIYLQIFEVVPVLI